MHAITALAVLTIAAVCSSGVSALRSMPAKDSPVAWEKPWFCHGLDCPEFDVVKTHDDYEIREYDQSTWMATEVTGLPFELALTRGFTKLFKYISGNNDGKLKINMTTPVLTQFEPLNGFTSAKKNFTVAFYLPYNFQKVAPPVPKDDSLNVTCVKPFTAYVYQFGGYAFEGKILQAAGKLADTLRDDGVDFYDGLFWYNSYDPPQRIQGRHNEVFFVEKM